MVDLRPGPRAHTSASQPRVTTTQMLFVDFPTAVEREGWHTPSDLSADTLGHLERESRKAAGSWDSECETYFEHELARSALLRVYARIFGFAVLLEPGLHEHFRSTFEAAAILSSRVCSRSSQQPSLLKNELLLRRA